MLEYKYLLKIRGSHLYIGFSPGGTTVHKPVGQAATFTEHATAQGILRIVSNHTGLSLEIEDHSTEAKRVGGEKP